MDLLQVFTADKCPECTSPHSPLVRTACLPPNLRWGQIPICNLSVNISAGSGPTRAHIDKTWFWKVCSANKEANWQLVLQEKHQSARQSLLPTTIWISIHPAAQPGNILVRLEHAQYSAHVTTLLSLYELCLCSYTHGVQWIHRQPIAFSYISYKSHSLILLLCIKCEVLSQGQVLNYS